MEYDMEMVYWKHFGRTQTSGFDEKGLKERSAKPLKVKITEGELIS